MLGTSPPAAPERPDKPDQMRRMITRSATPFAVALILGLAGPARADLSADPPLPQFSETDIARIEQNATLRELRLYNPWLTYRVLRTIDAEVGTRRDMPEPRPPSGPVPFDEEKDPDLGKLQRVAPEAAADLFDRIKRASGTNPPAK